MLHGKCRSSGNVKWTRAACGFFPQVSCTFAEAKRVLSSTSAGRRPCRGRLTAADLTDLNPLRYPAGTTEEGDRLSVGRRAIGRPVEEERQDAVVLSCCRSVDQQRPVHPRPASSLRRRDGRVFALWINRPAEGTQSPHAPAADHLAVPVPLSVSKSFASSM